MKKSVLTSLLAVVISLIPFTHAHAEPRKLPSWGAACPDVIDSNSTLEQPKIIKFQFNGHIFTRLIDGGTNSVTEPAPLVGCYVDLSAITSLSPEWQIGVINRDAQGFYWKNAAQVSWRLTLTASKDGLMTDSGNPYFNLSNKFTFFDSSAQPKTCKLKDLYQGGVRIGFDRNPQRVSSVGLSKNLILVMDYSDLPYSGEPEKLVDQVLSPQKVHDFYSSNSYGALDLNFETHPKVIRAQQPSSYYLPDSSGNFFVNGMWQDQRITAEILNEASKTIDLLKYQSVSILVSGGQGMGGYYGAAVPGNTVRVNGGEIRNTSVMGVGIGTIDTKPVPSWKVFAHEMGHLLGFIDLYIPGVENSKRSPGPFDLMGNTSGSANDFLGWHRWLQGWIEDSAVVCDLNFPIKSEIKLQSIASKSGIRLYVTPLSSTKLLALEYRTDSLNDRLNGEDGLLAYVIDLEIQSTKGAVKILQSEGDIPSNWRTDRDYFATATIEPGQVLIFNDVVIRNTQQNQDSASFVIETLSEYQKYVDGVNEEKEKLVAAAAKAEADLKLAAEAKARAELLAKEALAQKKSTISCIKGKIVKKVTAVKPKCPAGYKKR